MNAFRFSQRLHNPGEYSAVFNRRGRIRGSCFELQHAHTGGACSRLGLVIAKRHAKFAVQRNLIKRQIREVFRNMAPLLPVEDVVVRLTRPLPRVDVREQKAIVRNEIEDLFRRFAKLDGLSSL